MTIPDDAPLRVEYSLAEALDLLSDLELVREAVRGTDMWAVQAAVESQYQRLARKLQLDQEEGGPDAG